MKDSCIVKSNKYGLTLVLNHEIEFEKLVKDICIKFMENREFFGAREFVIRLEGRELTTEESMCIIEAIELNSDIKVSLIEENDVLKDIRMQDKLDSYFYEDVLSNAKIHTGSVKKGETLTSDSSLCILGDVKSGANVSAAGSIIVLGSLQECVHAGYPDDNSCFIATSDLACDQASIGNVTSNFEINDKWSFRSKKKDNEPMGLIVWNKGGILCEPLKSGILKHKKK